MRKAEIPLLLGIDLGTQGVKAGLVDPGGNVVASSTCEYPTATPKPGWAEQDPELWWEATLKALRKLEPGSLKLPGKLEGIAVSGQMHGSVLLDGKGSVVRPCILWCDQRTASQCVTITRRIGRERLRELASNPALPGFTAPKVLWVKENEPESFARISRLLLPKDYINYRLTGNVATDVSDASGTLFFDVKKRRWSEEVLEELEVPPSFMPEVLLSVETCGRVTGEASEATGIPEGTPVAAGGADNAASAVGMGVFEEGKIAVSIGSSGTVLAPTEAPVTDPQMRLHMFCHSVPDRWYLMGVMLTAGLSMRWLRDQLGEPEKSLSERLSKDAYELLDETAAEAPPGCEGLIFLPYLSGERTPHADPCARGVLFGIDLTKTRGHVVRAVMEGVAYGLRDSLVIMRELGIEPSAAVAGGGGSRSLLWKKIQADTFGMPVESAAQSDTAMLGAALIAGVSCGVFKSFEEAGRRAVSRVETVKPDPVNNARYEAYYGVYRSLYPALKDAFRKISELSEGV